MKFGKVDQPELIDFTMPQDHPDTHSTLSTLKNNNALEVFVGCAKWNRADLKGFYPFFPKLNQEISHWKRLNEVSQQVENYLYAASNLKEKLGTIFLQMHSNFSPKDFDRVIAFAEAWPTTIPLTMEFRHTDWYTNTKIADELYHLLKENNIANALVDTAGRRDIMHMRLSNNEAFIRYVGANHESDYTRLDDWVIRLKEWVSLGLKKIHFFVHQNLEVASPLLSAHFIKNLNEALGTTLTVPSLAKEPKTLF